MIFIYPKPGKIMIESIDENGNILDTMEFFSIPAAKKYYAAKYGPEGERWQWTTTPWKEPEIKNAEDNYLNTYGIEIRPKTKVNES